MDSEGIWVFTHEPARTRGRPDTLFSTPHIKHGQNGTLGVLDVDEWKERFNVKKEHNHTHGRWNRGLSTVSR